MTALVAEPNPTFVLQNKIRFVTAASLFDGHDAAIQIMRRILQQEGAEVIHLGHDRSVDEVVNAAIQEDAHGIALSSYQGGHVEYFTYMLQELERRGAAHIKIFGGGGGVIVPEEIDLLHKRGVARIFSPEDGRKMGLVGMIRFMLTECDNAARPEWVLPKSVAASTWNEGFVARSISALEKSIDDEKDLVSRRQANEIREVFAAEEKKPAPAIGFTGTGGAGKSSLIDEVLLRFLEAFPEKKVAVLSVDPTRRRTGGALLGDRIRMNAGRNHRVFIRSMATRRAHSATSEAVKDALEVLKNTGFDLVILETAGIGQSDSEVTELAGLSCYVMTPEYGAPSQLEKIDMLDFADLVVINKFDKDGAEDALRDVRKTYQRNRQRFEEDPSVMPVFPASAHRFHDPGTNTFFNALMKSVTGYDEENDWSFTSLEEGNPHTDSVIPRGRTRYLADVANAVRGHHEQAEEDALLAEKVDGLRRTLADMDDVLVDGSQVYSASPTNDDVVCQRLRARHDELFLQMSEGARRQLEVIDDVLAKYREETQSYEVRGKEFVIENYTESLSENAIPKVAVPIVKDLGDRIRFAAKENVPGAFPFTAGVFPFKRTGEDPTRMFAGEGPPERTNARFHYLARGQKGVRLSTAFDSVTLYGADPDTRPDIYGKVGNSGVSVCSLDDAKRLYSGFDLVHKATSVSMTINGPAPMLLAYYLNAAVDAACERKLKAEGRWEETDAKIDAFFADRKQNRPTYRRELPEGHDGSGLGFLGLTADRILDADEYESVKDKVLQQVRGTVQADILKEDQAQNTCIFSTEFALKMMGDVQEFFSKNGVRNFYSVSISGYHIAEAGANPITQLAFTLANGFTLVEAYKARGLDVNAFAPSLSFFFSNGLDPEYAVIGRVARRIWAIAMRDLYQADERSQKLKYHIQTSGRSLHAQEIDFNDIRTTLQALYAIVDNCNSLHTNAYDEAITTPTEDSVRRALAIQLIINRELGMTKNENAFQGSFFIDQLTDLVEEAVLKEFERLDSRGGVLGAMETMYQRSKIQDESMKYEHQKHTGELPIIGVNTFLPDDTEDLVQEVELIRSSEEEKNEQVAEVVRINKMWAAERDEALEELKDCARRGENLFGAMMEAGKVCTLGSISAALFEVGGAYRRSM
ncbi:MAG: methylmalonyl-CoA mutase family protein [Deltaproteobacteria bacterium]|nr:methylmalonyl-CoA mutase family protein [Deltaproteobacteria bacterium]